MDHGESSVASEMVDLTEVDLAALPAHRLDSESALTRALRRIVADAERPSETLAGFQASL